ncbi:methyltransferase domain-containing protein [Nonomuraea wenchangensis]
MFGEVADEYERIRPGYPAELVDDVLAYARLAGTPALEVGAGTGKATVLFAARGVTLTAVEPDPAMAAVLEQRVAGLPGVTIIVSSFEDHVPDQPFGLLLSAQAWHWTDPAVRWEKAAAALAPGGALALFWNFHRPKDPDVVAGVLAAHQRHAPHITPNARPIDDGSLAASLAASWPQAELETLADFGELSARLYRSERTLSGADYLAYLSTQSAYLMLDDTTRAELFAALKDAVGEQVTLSVDTALHLARRTG